MDEISKINILFGPSRYIHRAQIKLSKIAFLIVLSILGATLIEGDRYTRSE